MSEDKVKDPIAALVATTVKNGGSKGGPKKFGKDVDPAVGKATRIQPGQKLRLGKKKKVGLMTAALEKVGSSRVPKAMVEKLNEKGAGLRYGITYAELAARGQFAKSAEGVVDNFKLIADRTDGPVPEPARIAAATQMPTLDMGRLDLDDGSAREQLTVIAARFRERIAQRQPVILDAE